MKKHFYAKCSFVMVVFFLTTASLNSQITGPNPVCEGTTGVAYTAPAGMAAHIWTVSGGLTYIAGPTSDVILMDWPLRGLWTLSVSDGVNSPVTLDVTVNPVRTITGPVDPLTNMPATLGFGATPGQIYLTEPGWDPYIWTVSPGGTIVSGQGTSQITIDWLAVKSHQTVSVTSVDPYGCSAPETVFMINYFPFSGPIDPGAIPQFVDPLPHFAAGLRVNAKAGGNLIIKTVPVQQVALSTGTLVGSGIIGTDPGAGLGNYAAYAISKDNGKTWGVPMWPAQTIEAKQGNQLTVQYLNGLNLLTYDHFNILADQTLMMNGYTTTGDPLTEPYLGEIPMVVHLHGGEIPSNSDGGPNAWFMPSGAQGPAFGQAQNQGASSLVTYPNQQEAATLWYHPHDDGLTRINVYTGLAGYYFLRGEDEEAAQLPGWSGDDLVKEATPPGKSPTFNGANAYLPEIELGIQDRMFDTNGALYWPVAPPNPELHPFWTPEFVGDIFVVNGKTWPYLSVAPRKYRFRILDGCNARWLNMWLVNAADGTTPGPKITVVGAEGGLLATPVDLDPVAGKALNIGPGQRADVVIDFTGIAPGTTFTLKNNAGAPYPFGDPVVPGLTDVIMQFVVNGSMVSAADPAIAGTDKSLVPANLRPVNPLVTLTDFAGTIDPAVTPAVTRQIILNEVMSFGGPAAVLVNNTYFDAKLAIAGDPAAAGGPTEFPLEGTTEKIQIANVSADAHPMHIHLMQWQLVSRQPIDDAGYLQAYADEWIPRGLPSYPAGSMDYPGGAGSPLPYDVPNADGAVGGNPAFSPFLTLGPAVPAELEERGWKDNVTVLPGMVSTFVMRVAPTDRPVNAAPSELLFPFDPSLGPGYVWHCHVIDHEDMSMMRPLEIHPSPLRLVLPQITVQPAPEFACAGDVITYSVTATSPKPITYNWQLSIDDGKTWTPLTDVAPYSGSATASLSITPATLPLNGFKFKCILTNADGVTTSNPALLTVTNCSINGTLKYNNATLDPLAGFTVTIGTVTPLSAVTDATGAFIINGVTSGIWPVTVTTAMLPGGVNSTDAGTVNAWVAAPSIIPNVKFLSGDVDNSMLIAALDAQGIQNNFVNATAFARGPWVFWDAIGSGTVNPLPFTVAVNRESVTGFDILGMSTGDFNSSFKPNVAGGLPNVALTSSGVTLTVAADMPFTLPINSTAALTGVGAISLVLNVPANMVKVQGVSIAGSAVPAVFKSIGNVLRIGWYSNQPVNVPPGQPLVNLTLVPKTTFTTADILTITLGTNPLSELADATMTPVANPQLTVDNVIESAAPVNHPALTIVSVFPNPAPATGPITITYTLAGLAEPVTMVIINSKGVVMTTVVNNTVLDGTPVTASLTGWAKGQYIIRLTQTVAGTNYVATAKFMVK